MKHLKFGTTPENTTTETTAPEALPVLVAHEGMYPQRVCYSHCEDVVIQECFMRLDGGLNADGEAIFTYLPISDIIRIDVRGGVTTM